MQLAHFDIAAFLRSAWQKQPLLIRNPWANWQNPLAPDELAGLACERAIESRLVRRSGGRANGRLICENGPLQETRFAKLPKKHWTLLVQAADHHIPTVAALIEPFRFIPNWRIDDVMVSYAADGGGVGPHFDNYDVFLIQGLGQRRWRIGQACTAASPLLPHDDLRLLAEFTPVAEYLLEPGDILYLPPGIAHDGVAVGGDCMTYSVGFRAPARGELIGDWADDLLAGLSPDDRYTDPALPPQDNPGEITAAALVGLHRLVTEPLHDPVAFAHWFGRYTTTPRYPDADWRPDTPLEATDLQAGTKLYRNPASRFAFVRHPGVLSLFVDGACFTCRDAAATFAAQLCAHPALTLDPQTLASPETKIVIVQLYNQGSVSFDPA